MVNKTKSKELIGGAVLSYVQMILNALISIFYTPFLLNALGQSEYGLYSTVSATISIISLLNLGLGNGYIRYYTKYEKIGDQDGKNKLNGMFLLIFTTLGVVSLIIGLAISNNLSLIFKDGFTSTEYVIAKRLSIILSLNLAVSFPTIVFSSIITAHERFVISKLIGMLRTVLAPVITIPLFLLGYKSIAFVSISFVVSIISDISLVLYAIFTLKEKFTFFGFESGLFKGLIIYILPITFNLATEQLNLNIDKLLIGRYNGAKNVAVYNIGYTLFAMYMMVSTAVSSVFVPRVHEIVNRNSENSFSLREELTSLFTKVGRIQCELLMLVLTGMIFFGMPFITTFWAGNEYADSYYVLLLLAIPATIPFLQNLGIEIQRAENLHRFRSIVYTAMAIVNLGLSIYLCQKYGAIGSAIGTAISFILCNGIIMNIFYHKKCSIDIVYFWKKILRILIAIVPTILIWLVIRRFFDLNNIAIFITGVVVYTLIYCIFMWIIGMNKEEKDLVKDSFISLRKRLIKR